MRRFGALVLSVALLASCGGPAEPEEPEPSNEPVRLSLGVYGSQAVSGVLTSAAKDFETGQRKVSVATYSGPGAAARELLALDRAELPDVFMVDYAYLGEFLRARRVQPVDHFLGERGVDFGDGFARDALETFSDANRLQCMPLDYSPLVVYLNTDLVDLAAYQAATGREITPQVGWNLETFTDVARWIARKPGASLHIAPRLSQVAPFLWSGGADIVDDRVEPRELKLGDAQDPLSELLTVVRDPGLTFGAGQLAAKSATERFADGGLGMMLGHRALTPVFRAQEGLSFDVMPLPRLGSRATSATATALCMSPTAADPEAAADLIADLVSRKVSAALARTGEIVTPNLDVAHSTAFLQPNLQPANASVFLDQVRRVRWLPTGPLWRSVEVAVRPGLEAMFHDEGIDPLAERLQQLDLIGTALLTDQDEAEDQPRTTRQPN